VLAVIGATDGGSGVAGTGYRLDGGSWTPAGSLLVSADGDHVLEYRAADNAGNVSRPQTVRVKTDTVRPTTSGYPTSVRSGGTKVETLPATQVTVGRLTTVTWVGCGLAPRPTGTSFTRRMPPAIGRAGPAVAVSNQEVAWAQASVPTLSIGAAVGRRAAGPRRPREDRKDAVMRTSFELPALLCALLFGVLLIGAGALAPEAGAVSFAPRADYPTETRPQGVAVGDFNGDGDQDLAVATAESSVDVFLGDGAGGFGAYTSYPTGDPSTCVAVGDFNGDGDQDLAVGTGSEGPGAVSVLLGDGAGGFGAPSTHPVTPAPTSIALSDLNGDGKQDIVSANLKTSLPGAGSVTVLLGDGAGGFGAPTYSLDDTFRAGVAVADFNGDGKPDLAVTTYYGDSVSVALGVGDGSFGAPVDYAIGDMPFFLVTGDFDGDGKADLAAANGVSSSVSALLGDGAGGFGAATSFASGLAPVGIASGDFNSDAKLDLVTADVADSTAGVLLGDGAGGFGANTGFSVSGWPWGVAVGDFNGDAKQDLVTTDQNGAAISVLLGEWEVPTGSIVLSGGAAATASRAVTVDADVAEAEEMRLRDAGGTWSDWSTLDREAPWTLPAGDGVRTVEAQYRSTAGESAVLSDSILLDTTAPVTTSDAPEHWVPGPAVTVTLTASDGEGSGVAKTQYKLDGAADWTDGTTVVVGAEGVHTLAYRSIDKVGNVEKARRATIGIDADPPAPTATVAGATAGWQRRPVRLRFTGAAASGGAPVARTEYRLNGGKWRSGDSVRVTRQGVTRVEYRAVDVLGLAGAARRLVVRIDARRPRVVARSAAASRGSVARLPFMVRDPRPGSGTALVRLVVSDARGHIVTRSSTRPVTTNARHTVRVSTAGLAPGTYRVALRARDRAGNFQRGVTAVRLTVR